MLHNDGPYGPSEAPENMGALVNIGSLGASPNTQNNMSNLDKIAHQSTQDPSGRYHLPDFSSYNHQNLGLSSQMSPYPNYTSVAFQPTYTPQNTASAHNTGWQSSVLPSQLNAHPFNTANMSNYPHYGRSLDNQMYSSESTAKNMPINAPQVSLKPFPKADELDICNTNPVKYEDFTNINGEMITKTQDRPLMDSTKRKSLENTVRLIENILSNTAKNKEMQKNQFELNILSDKDANIKTLQNDNTQKPEETSLLFKAITNNELKTEPENKIKSTKIHNNNNRKESNVTKYHKDLGENSKNNISSDYKDEYQQKTANHTKTTTENEKNTYTSDSTSTENTGEILKTEQENPLEIKKVSFIKVEQTYSDSEKEFVTQVDVKVEPYWNDFEDLPVFQRDVNGRRLHEIGDANIVLDADTSMVAAKDAIRSCTDSQTTYYECPSCSMLFNHPKRYLIHYKWHLFGLTNERRSQMAREREMCKEQRKEIRLMNNKAKTKGSNNSEVQNYSCKDCDKVFRSKSSLKNHRHRFHPTRTLECSVCSLQVLGSLALKAHEAAHSSRTPTHQCPDCHKLFVYKHSRDKHRATHMEKTLPCPQCPKMFGTNTQLKMHQKVHERAEKGTKFSCSYCAKGFYESYNLIVHERTHRGERPYLCEICNTSYGTNSSLKRHLKVSHSTSKPFECPTCHRSFAAETTRDRHQIRAHGDPEQLSFHCDLCGNRYLHQRDLTKHVYKAHKKGKRKKVSDSE